MVEEVEELCPNLQSPLLGDVEGFAESGVDSFEARTPDNPGPRISIGVGLGKGKRRRVEPSVFSRIKVAGALRMIPDSIHTLGSPSVSPIQTVACVDNRA